MLVDVLSDLLNQVELEVLVVVFQMLLVHQDKIVDLFIILLVVEVETLVSVVPRHRTLAQVV